MAQVVEAQVFGAGPPNGTHAGTLYPLSGNAAEDSILQGAGKGAQDAKLIQTGRASGVYRFSVLGARALLLTCDPMSVVDRDSRFTA